MQSYTLWSEVEFRLLQSHTTNLKSKIDVPGWRNWQTRQT